ncbi:MAG: TrkH family potassium uptake protein [Lachnospiraceae bacterium]|nr:TrkH family potassium uptake protein [Lachnospiraceae bacterium]
MNYSIIIYIIGWVLSIESVLMLLPCLTALVFRETAGFSFLITIALCLLAGLPLVLKKPKNKLFYLREGFVATSLSWIVLSTMGALPFWISGSIPDPIDALFETVSGFTTTGASILTNVEALPRCMLIWRSFTHWIGGMGVLVFLLIILPMSGGSHMNLMKAESPGPSVNRILPKVQSTAKVLYIIYITLTAIQVLLLSLGNIPLFDALTTAFGTAGTGGFGIKNDSIAGYSAYIQIVTTVFMILFGVNFNIYYLLLIKKVRLAFSSEEVRMYFSIIIASILLITINITANGYYSSFGAALQQASFQVASIITTTGFATADFNLWPQFSKVILVMLMFIGACAGSTGGGIKISRILIMLKTVRKELRQLLHPRSIKKIQIDGKSVEHEVVRSTNVYLITFILLFAFSVLLISLEGYDLVTSFTAVAATINNIGPGLELVGPTGNFAFFSYGSKIVLIFDMLAGRLELFPLLLLFTKDTWKRF